MGDPTLKMNPLKACVSICCLGTGSVKIWFLIPKDVVVCPPSRLEESHRQDSPSA